ncbi:MAG: MFS transporter [Chloroflexota bacterium]
MSIFSKRPSGMNAFYTIWVGQFFSLLGTGMTRFALTLWAWELTGSATALAFVAFFGFLPSIVMSPIAGALVDRWDRKLVMMLSDLAAGVGTILLLILSLNGSLVLWHVYAITFVAGMFESFQFPAYSAAITTMVSKDHYARTSAMLGLANSASNIFAPITAASLYGLLSLNGILALDIVTFVIAYGTLLFVKIPAVKRSAEGADSQSGVWQEISYGFRFIWNRKSLFWLQTAFFFANFVFGMAIVLTNPMILARTGNNETILGIVSACMAGGGFVGGLLMSAHGGFKERRVRGVLWGFMASGLLGTVVLGAGQTILFWVIGAFAQSAFLSPINASNQAIWQSKVPPDVQGKVFAARRVIAAISTPAAMIIGGLLADYVFEPAMQANGALAPIFGGLVGTGDGAGMGLMFVFVGLATVVIGLVAYSAPIIRDVETIVPDFDPNLVAES